jgi:hypothetical protein
VALSQDEVDELARQILPLGWHYQRHTPQLAFLQMPNGKIATLTSMYGMESREELEHYLRGRMDKLERTGGL